MYAPAQEAFIVNYLWPVLVVVFGFLILKEILSLTKIFGIVLSFFGVYVVITQGNIFNFTFTNIPADLLAIFGAVSYALFSVLGKKYNYEVYTSMLVYYASGFVCVFITTLLFSTVPSLSLSQWIGIAWIGVVTNVFAFVCWFKALEYGDTSKMANLIFLTPFVSLIYIYFILNEQILVSSFVGLVLIVVGVLVQTKISRSQQKL